VRVGGGTERTRDKRARARVVCARDAAHAQRIAAIARPIRPRPGLECGRRVMSCLSLRGRHMHLDRESAHAPRLSVGTQRSFLNAFKNFKCTCPPPIPQIAAGLLCVYCGTGHGALVRGVLLCCVVGRLCGHLLTNPSLSLQTPSASAATLDDTHI